ncbi:hypothetical protein NECAME_18131 [Necator americanus]|uniref:Uncharacterized protein n=1 Tax=Necator americanus TaxID=51031 RepID=W2TDW6_NECAM|nr:hypothetical protein NECAME_18131 [Necator americanus]ETN79381.1 hypothetical protein NECAME_18131 [Necator americanus]
MRQARADQADANERERACNEKNERTDPRSEQHAKRHDGNGLRGKAAVERLEQHPARREHHAGRDGAQAALERQLPRGALITAPDMRDAVDEDSGWQQERGGRHERAPEAGNLPADQRDEQRARTRGHARNREIGGELRMRHPRMHFDDLALNLGDDRLAAADRHERKWHENGGQLTEQARVHRAPRRIATYS